LTNQRRGALTSQIRDTEAEEKKLVSRVLDTNNDTLVAAYEQQIYESEARKVELKEQLEQCGRRLGSFGDAFRTAMIFFASHCKNWISDSWDLKQMVLKLVFVNRLE